MDYDLELQSAIYSSLKNHQTTPNRTHPTPRVQHVPNRERVTTSSMPRQNGKRNCLQREGIMPTLPRSNAERAIVSSLSLYKRHSPDRPEWVSNVEEETDFNSTNPPFRMQQPSDRIPGWTEMCTGGRVQRQSTTAAHVLLISDEMYQAPTMKIHCSDLLLLRSVSPLPHDSTKACFALQVQSLVSRGQYAVFGMGITSDAGEEMSGFPLVMIHYESSGGVFISVEQWRITEKETFERMQVLEKMTPIRLIRDHITLILVASSDKISLSANGEVLYPIIETTGLKLGTALPIFLGSGGKISVRNISVSSGDTPPKNQSSTRSRLHLSSPPSHGGGSAKRGGNYGIMTEDGDTSRPSRGNAGKNQSDNSRRRNVGGKKPAEKPRKGSIGEVSLPPGINGELAERIETEIIEKTPNVQWEDIAGIPEAKRLLSEAVILPLLVPELFTGVVQPWKGVLMFGPPGTGKTMLARAVATSAKTTFFNMSASSLISKYFGESEKMVRTLFQLARHYAPSTIFFDELDSLMSTRGGSNEHEASRRVKSEMLQQIDGLATESEKRVMVLATTNRPWDLDEAMRRRLEKRIYIPLPDYEGRLDLLKKQAASLSMDGDLKMEIIAKKTEGFSGADMNLLVRDAAMMPMRRLIADKSPAEIATMKEKGEMILSPVKMDDFKEALKKIQPSVSQASLKEFEKWSEEFGSV